MSSMLWPILRRALRHPRRTAVIDDQRTWRYLDLVGGALHLAKRIERKTDAKHIALLLPTSGAFAMALLATWMLKRVAVPINYLLSAGERQRILDHSDAGLVVTAGKMLEFLGDEPEGVELLKLDELESKGLPPLRLPPLFTGDDELAALLYTSGTSGAPKGVMLTHGNLISNVDGAIAHARLTESNGFVGVLPQFHSFGLTALTLIPLRLGARVIYTARFVPTRLVQLIADHEPDVFMAIPSMYHALLGVKSAGPEDLRSVRLAISGAEPLPESTREQFHDKYDITILEGYGLTETSPVVSWCMPETYKIGSVGTLLPNVEVRIIDPEGEPLPTGEDGEIIIRGPNIMAGYYKQPDLTAEVVDDEGFFHTGDMGRLDEDGFLYITGRIKDMMIIGGENVFPREIEEVLARHEAVAAVGVVGRTDPSRGEVPVAFVEIAEGQRFDESQLRQWCRQHLAGYKVPKEIRQVDALPRSPTGKVLRRQLSERLERRDDEEATELHRDQHWG